MNHLWVLETKGVCDEGVAWGGEIITGAVIFLKHVLMHGIGWKLTPNRKGFGWLLIIS